MERLAALSLAAVPVLFPPETAAWHGIALAMAAVAAAVALAGPDVRPPGRRGFLWALLALAPLSLSTWFTSDAGATRDRLVLFAIYLVAFRAGRDLLADSGGIAPPGTRPGQGPAAGGGRSWGGLLGTLAALGSLTAAYGIYHRVIGFDRALAVVRGMDLPAAPAIAQRLESGRVFATFLLPSTFASFLLLSVPATVAWGLASRRAGRILATAAVALQGTALFLTYSHGAWVALAAAAVASVALGGPPRWRTAALATSGVALVALVAVAGLRGETLGRGDDPVSERLGNWSVAAEQIADHPLTGVGWGGYGASYTRYQRPGMNQSRYAHNTWLQLVAEGGLLTLPFLAIFLATAGRNRRWRRPADLVLRGGLVAVLLHNVIDFTLLLPAVGVPFFLLLGSCRPGDAPGRAAPLAGRVAAASLAAGIALLGIPAAVARGQAATAREDVVQGRMEPAGRRVSVAVRLDPWTGEYRDFAARWELESGGDDPVSLRRARELAEEAIRLAPAVPHHRATLEDVCVAQGDLECAFRSASRAAALFPGSNLYRTRRDALRRALEAR